jgi:hypothetical protein
MEILDQAFEAARTFRPMDQAKVATLLAKTAGDGARGKFELFKTATNPAWLGEEPDGVKKLMPA